MSFIYFDIIWSLGSWHLKLGDVDRPRWRPTWWVGFRRSMRKARDTGDSASVGAPAVAGAAETNEFPKIPRIPRIPSCSIRFLALDILDLDHNDHNPWGAKVQKLRWTLQIGSPLMEWSRWGISSCSCPTHTNRCLAPRSAYVFRWCERVSESWSWHLEHLYASLCVRVRSNAYAYEMISDKYPMYSSMSSYFLCNAMPFHAICLCLFFICFHLQSKFRTYADGRNHANSISHGRV